MKVKVDTNTIPREAQAKIYNRENFSGNTLTMKMDFAENIDARYLSGSGGFWVLHKVPYQSAEFSHL